MLEKYNFNTKFLQKITFLRLKIMFLWVSLKKIGILKVTEERSQMELDPNPVVRGYGSADLDPHPHKNVTDP